MVRETIQYYPDINWLYYLQAHDVTLPPLGAIFIDRITRNAEYPFNVDDSQKIYQFHLRLKISRYDYDELLFAMENWESELNDKICRKLQVEGHEGYFQGIHPDPRQPSVFEVDKNQDEGAKGNLHLFWVWHDGDRVSQIESSQPFF